MANLTNLYNPEAEAQGDLAKLPTGEYVVQIIDSDLKPTKNNDGQFLALTYEVMEGPLAGRKHFDNINLEHTNPKVVKIANRQFASIREATGVPNPRTSEELHFRPHVIRIENYPAGTTYTSGSKKGQVREYEDAQIKSWKALEGATPTQSAPSTATQVATQAAGRAPWGRAA